MRDRWREAIEMRSDFVSGALEIHFTARLCCTSRNVDSRDARNVATSTMWSAF
jgi:hypothetical protein